MAILADVTAKASGAKHTKPADFLPKFGSRAPMSAAEIMGTMQAFAATQNAKRR